MQAAAVVAATPAASKPTVQLKNPVVAKEGATTAGEQGSAAGTADTTATATSDAGSVVPSVTPHTEAAGKPKGENGSAGRTKLSEMAVWAFPIVAAMVAAMALGRFLFR